jgi:pyruvate dehydrogenase E1 component beta subunit
VRYGAAGLTTGLHEKYPDRVITYPVSESLMNASTMGLSLSGKRPVMVHERMDFLASGMDALVNHIPIWKKKCGVSLPLVILAIVGKGGGQGPQHSKDLTSWFKNFEGWTVCVPETPLQAYSMMKSSIFGDSPVMYVAHRETFDKTGLVKIETPSTIGLCGASPKHERDFYRP